MTEPVSVTSTDSPTVTSTEGGAQLPDDRPVQNVVAEMNRKFGKLQSQMDSVLQALAAQYAKSAVPAPEPVAQPAQVSDEDLWALAQQGNRQAFDMYQDRIAQRRLKQDFAVRDRQQAIEGQLRALMSKYPVLNDPSHALTQTMTQTYQLLVQRGYPSNAETLLEAGKLAIADNPQIVAEIYSAGRVATDATRTSARRTAQTGQTGSSVRSDSTPASPTLSPDELRLAARMGVKDPTKSRERFLKRNAEGRSALEPVVAGIVEGELNAQ